MKKILVAFFISIFCISNSSYASEKIKMTNKQPGIYVFKINTKKYGDKIKPYVSSILTTPKSVYENKCFDLVVNAGFFDVKTGKSVSYITIDGKMVEDVKENTALLESLTNDGRLEKVLSRGELRILENDNHKLKFDIARHNDPVPKGYTIKHALQSGPILLPDMNLVDEGFVIYGEKSKIKFQSADILKRRERTAIALKGNKLYIIIFTKDNKVDANELACYIHDKIKAKKALAFDGGLSTAINYKNTSIGSLGKQQRRVKSFLIIER